MKIAIAGLGTVGQGVYESIISNADIISKRSNCEIEVVAASARTKQGKNINFDSLTWYDNAVDIANDENVDTVIELIGGDSGVAYDLCVQSIKNKKNVVTANKALISKHGNDLAKLAEENDVNILYEAAVAGGIPVIKMLREGLSSNKITSVLGILNGTCNFILSQMEKNSLSFEEALKQAQEVGYAEADPSFDVGGIDAAHKLSIISSLAFGSKINFNATEISGIESVGSRDIEYASEFGYKIRLVGECSIENDAIKQRVKPFLVKEGSFLANIDGADNAVLIKGDMIGKLSLIGPGAGKLETASSVIADIIDVARERFSNILSVKTSDISDIKFLKADDFTGKYYLKINVEDSNGVLSSVSNQFKNNDISISQITQRNISGSKNVDIVIITDICKEDNIYKVIDKLNIESYVKQKITLISIGDDF